MKSFSWKTPEYHHKQRSKDWYWIVGIITTAIIIVCIIFGDALFAVVLAVGIFTLTLLSIQKPKIVEVEIGERGVTIDRTVYPYPVLDAFGIDMSQRGSPHLMLKSKKVFMPLMQVPTPEEHMDEIRSLLKTHLKEEVFEQGFMQTMFDRLGF